MNLLFKQDFCKTWYCIYCIQKKYHKNVLSSERESNFYGSLWPRGEPIWKSHVYLGLPATVARAHSALGWTGGIYYIRSVVARMQILHVQYCMLIKTITSGCWTLFRLIFLGCEESEDGFHLLQGT